MQVRLNTNHIYSLMSVNKFNSEGYYDPTTFEAMTNIRKKEKNKVYKPLVYICSPYAGEIETNTDNAKKYCRFAMTQNCIPLAPHLLYPQFMDESVPSERELGLFFGLVLLGKCSELWVFGDRITKGMAMEIDKAKRKNQQVRYFNYKCEETSEYAICKGYSL